MKRTSIFLLALLLGSVAQADTAKMNAVREALDRLDREEFFGGIEAANVCTVRQNFACAEEQLEEVKQLANGASDERLFALAVSNLQAEKQRVAEEARIRRELEEQRQARIAAERAAEERAERRQRREEEEQSARVIGAAIMGVGQSIGQAYSDMAAGEARVHADNAERQAAADRQFRHDQETARLQRDSQRREQQAEARIAQSQQLSAMLRQQREKEARAGTEAEASQRAYNNAQQTRSEARQSSALLTGATAASAGSSGAAATARPAATAPAVLTFTSNTGWQINDVSQDLSAQGLTVRIVVTPSTIAGKHYYRAEFCDAGAGAWKGGMRLTDSYPDRTHATIRVPAGGCTRWAEHLRADARQIYVLVRREGDH